MVLFSVAAGIGENFEVYDTHRRETKRQGPQAFTLAIALLIFAGPQSYGGLICSLIGLKMDKLPHFRNRDCSFVQILRPCMDASRY